MSGAREESVTYQEFFLWFSTVFFILALLPVVQERIQKWVGSSSKVSPHPEAAPAGKTTDRRGQLSFWQADLDSGRVRLLLTRLEPVTDVDDFIQAAYRRILALPRDTTLLALWVVNLSSNRSFEATLARGDLVVTALGKLHPCVDLVHTADAAPLDEAKAVVLAPVLGGFHVKTRSVEPIRVLPGSRKRILVAFPARFSFENVGAVHWRRAAAISFDRRTTLASSWARFLDRADPDVKLTRK